MTSELALRHDAFLYTSEDEYVERSVGFLREGLDAGEGAIVTNARAGLGMIREALGDDANRVTFVDVSETYTRPARAVAAYHGMLVKQLRAAPTVRAVAEVQMGPVDEAFVVWGGYEAICNAAYAHLPVWMVCSYNANELPDHVLDTVMRTHTALLGDGWDPNDRYEDPRTVVRRATPVPEPLAGLRWFSVGNDLEVFREQLARELVAERVPESKALETLVAASELGDNAVRHGGGIEEIRTGRAEGRFVCEVFDRGPGFDDPLAGYLVPRDGVGTGLWVVRQLAWRLEFFHSPAGFTARLWV
jgi:anti-sigma regulatory factor (Ser/Thr protein kinase)